MDNKTNAFSLIELAVVLVIIGLVSGGVLAARDLIRGAENRKYIVDLQKYETAINAFREKFFFFPGDMPNGVQFWGTHHWRVLPCVAGRDSECEWRVQRQW